MFYTIIRLPLNSIHRIVESSDREERNCLKRFKEIREYAIKNKTFLEDINNEKFKTTEALYYCTYKNL